MIPFSRPAFFEASKDYVEDTIKSGKLSGDGPYTQRCQAWFKNELGIDEALMVPSCTAALELSALLLDLGPEDEVILPSFAFTSTANAFALRGARLIFVDVEPDTMNIDPDLIEAAVSERTRVIVALHYAGVACDMDRIMEIAQKRDLIVVEDAAQGLMSSHRGRPLGTIGHLGCISFHETKNIVCGEGGALYVNDPALKRRAEIIREKGTNRSEFFRGEVDRYNWQDIGSSYLLGEINAALLLGQLDHAREITADRLATYDYYKAELKPLAEAGHIEFSRVPTECEHNAHIFFFKVTNLEVRTKLLQFLRERKILATFHYVPLHSAPAGRRGEVAGELRWTEVESERLVRLPLYFGMSQDERGEVVSALKEFFP